MMELSNRRGRIKLKAGAGIMLAAALCTSCSGLSTRGQLQIVKAEQSFASAGSIEMHLDGGDYAIRTAATDQIRVSFGGNIGDAKAELVTNGTHANLVVKDTPHSNFHAIIEVPKTSDVILRLAGGNLEMTVISGNKDIESKAGNVEIAAGSPTDYASVDASVGVGNLDAGPFGESDSVISHHLSWSGHGKYTLRANLGAGNLELKGN
jgi:hypothetical protein